MSKTTIVDHIYSNGDLYNLLADERGSFYKDIHGLTRIIPFLELSEGILELGSGWDDRGARLLNHETPGVEYTRDEGNFVDLTLPNALAPAHANRKYSCVTGLCYLLNALNKHDSFEAADYDDLVTALRNVRSVLTPTGAAVFGIYHEDLLDDTEVKFKTENVEYPNPFWVERLVGTVDKSKPRSGELSYSLKCTHNKDTRRMKIEWTNIKVAGRKFKLNKPLYTTVWSVATIIQAAKEAGFGHYQTFSVTMGEERGYSSVVTEASSLDDASTTPNVSHILLYA